MNIKYYEDEKIEKNRKSIFLAGPTPRSNEILSWRNQALKILEELNFDGDVYVPESKKSSFGKSLDIPFKEIVNWELEHLSRADVICFWIPRDLKTMPAFTTNVEFGYHIKTGKIVYGRPHDAPKNRYLDFLYEKEYNEKPCETLEETLKKCLEMTKEKDAKIFFTSDTHFGQTRTLELSKRPFKNANEMDETIVKNWNKQIGKSDTIYHLGDFGDFKMIDKLNGNIILILGNYEIKDLETNFANDFSLYRKYLISLGFKDVIINGVSIELPGIQEKIYLTHKPLDCKKDMFNLFGHIHNLSKVKKFGLNVGIDCYNFNPVSTSEMLFYKNAIQNFYDNDVFCEKNDLVNTENDNDLIK